MEDRRKQKRKIINEFLLENASWDTFTLPTSLRKRVDGKNRLKLRGLVESKAHIFKAQDLPFEQIQEVVEERRYYNKEQQTKIHFC